jgi:hypothetical protein
MRVINSLAALSSPILSEQLGTMAAFCRILSFANAAKCRCRHLVANQIETIAIGQISVYWKGAGDVVREVRESRGGRWLGELRGNR